MPSFPLTAARRVVLIVGVPLTLALFCWAALSAVAFLGHASYSVARTVAWNGGAVTIAVDTGDLTVSPSKDNNVHVSGVVQYSVLKPMLHVSTSAAGVTVNLLCPPVLAGICSVDLVVTVPAQAVVVASSDSGAVTASSLTGATLSTDSGDLTATGLLGSAHFHTDSGGITATSLGASQVTASADSGSITLNFVEAPQRVTVQADSGSVTLAVPAQGTAYNIGAHTDSGTTTIGVPTDPASTNNISISVDSGDVHVEPNGNGLSRYTA
jgi:Putative adhesin